MNTIKTIKSIILPGIGFLGTVFGIFAFLYPNYVTEKIAVSYFLVVVLCALWIIAVLIITINEKNIIINNFSNETNFQLDLHPIRFNSDNYILILRKSVKIEINTMVTVFINQLDYEKSVAIGFVTHIQDKAIQIKVLENEQVDNLKSYFSNENNLSTVIIRPFIRIDDINHGGKK